MQMIHIGEHPEQASVIFMPMIDMKSSDESYILSTMHFVTEHAKRCNISLVLTFDQPLYWKGVEIQQCEDDTNPLKDIVFRIWWASCVNELSWFYWTSYDFIRAAEYVPKCLR